jgi:hypothetical protein
MQKTCFKDVCAKEGWGTREEGASSDATAVHTSRNCMETGK